MANKHKKRVVRIDKDGQLATQEMLSGSVSLAPRVRVSRTGGWRLGDGVKYPVVVTSVNVG